MQAVQLSSSIGAFQAVYLPIVNFSVASRFEIALSGNDVLLCRSAKIPVPGNKTDHAVICNVLTCFGLVRCNGEKPPADLCLPTKTVELMAIRVCNVPQNSQHSA
jgi:hypothetical protein